MGFTRLCAASAATCQRPSGRSSAQWRASQVPYSLSSRGLLILKWSTISCSLENDRKDIGDFSSESHRDSLAGASHGSDLASPKPSTLIKRRIRAGHAPAYVIEMLPPMLWPSKSMGKVGEM